MKKRILTLLLACIFIFVIAGCTTPTPQEDTAQSTPQQDTTQSASEEDTAQSTPEEDTALGIVQVEGGLISGVSGSDPNVTIYKGVPYAAPPVGELRWKAPEPVVPWDDVRACDEFGAIAVQYREMAGFFGKEFYPDGKPETSEDCLFLNVWTPAKSQNEALPVLVYIHGGGFAAGYSSEMEFDGEGYANKGVILVTINYRLNIFGLLAHPELSAESENGVSGNYGLLDQIAALQWVEKNIAAFGGDPDNVTLFGQSAGAGSVSILSNTLLTEGLFDQAIMQSGGGLRDGGITLAEAEALGVEVSTALDVDSIEELRSIPADELYTAITPFKQSFRPCIDGYVVPDAEQGSYIDIPYIIGYTAGDMVGLDAMVASFADSQAELGRENTYVYEFVRSLPGDDNGAWHSCELWYVFETLDRCWRPFTEGDYALSNTIASYWANFAKTGDPNAEGLPEWSSYTSDNNFKMDFDVEE